MALGLPSLGFSGMSRCFRAPVKYPSSPAGISGESRRVGPCLSLDGPIPLSPFLTLRLATEQSIVNTVDEVNNLGLVLRQVANARLTYTHSAVLTVELFAQYSRNELLESSGTIGGQQGQIDNLASASITGSQCSYREQA